MPTLYHSLGVGTQGLMASRQGVDTTGHNIANAQTEGYSRQRVNLRARYPLERRHLVIGNGVLVNSISRAHDKFIEKQINTTNQDVGYANAMASGLADIEAIFSPEHASTISDEITNFFNTMQDLSNFPEDYTVRTAVKAAANNLVGVFHNADADLKAQQMAIDEKLLSKTREVTSMLRQIANLNSKIQGMEVGHTGQQANDLRDQRDLLLRDLTKYMDINYYEDQYGMVLIRGPKNVTLVDRGLSAEVSMQKKLGEKISSDIVVHGIGMDSPRSLTDGVTRGELRGLIDLRESVLGGLIDNTNELAFSLTSKVNEIHRKGFGVQEYSEKTGRNFFEPPVDKSLAAATIAIDDAIVESNDAIAAASSPLAPGDNVIVNEIVRLRDQNVMAGGAANFTQYYAGYVGSLGLEVVRANHVKDANETILMDLHNKREAISGVSLDEEAINLMKWQQSFTASSKVITTVDEMLETVLSLKR